MTDIKPVLPGHETQSQEMNCPACGRYVGAVTRCPYCKAKVPKRISLMATRWAAILLATVGLFLLYLMALHRDVPVVMLGDIQATMNFGQIRVVGQVMNDARTFRNGSMGFNVTDGTGSIMVFVSQRQAQQLASRNMVPKAGDSINFVGGLNVSEQESSMRLLSVNELKLDRAPALETRLADINDTLIGAGVTVAGKVVGFSAPPPDSRRPYALTLSDGSGEMTINFWQAEYDQIANADQLDGAHVRMRVSVGSYQDKIQLTLSSGADLDLLDGPPDAIPIQSPAQKAAATFQKTAPARDLSRGRLAAAQPVAAITASQNGQTVKVRGRVASVRAPEAGSKQPFSLILEEGGASLRVTYWSNVDEVLAAKPVVGDVFEIDGVVDVYQDKPQLKVESGYKMIRIEAPEAAASQDPVAISSISAADKGQSRAVKGTLGAPRALGKGTAFALADDTGSIDLILWDSIIPAEVIAELKEGDTVVASGEVGEYQGQLQLKAAPGRSVTVVR
jgi:DNA/RNA endonuclease YhcR with UshA esterase domain